MKLYYVSQKENNDYDTFDSMVVAAESEEAARNTTPDGHPFTANYGSWASSPDNVTVELIAEDTNQDAGVICASFNAG